VPLSDFVATRGRLPDIEEIETAPQILRQFASVKRAFAIVRRVTGTGWSEVRQARADDLLVYLALARFDGRPPLSKLPRPLQLDVRAFFSTYATACRKADELLAEAGSTEHVDRLCRASAVGKETPSALYVHISAIACLSPVIRILEGCARAYIGTTAGANVIKVHRDKPSLSYLVYPAFDTDPHPALAGSLIVHLRGPAAYYRDYSSSEDPPVLHRKEELVAADYPLRAMFARLTVREDALGLFKNPTAIGKRLAWQAALERAGWKLRGHRLVRR
jgi:DNA phosphorothioation-associated putative methyltransferase